MKVQKKHYLTPQTEIEFVEIAPFAAMVVSWNPDKGVADDMLIIEGDPEGNGKGANVSNIWEEEDLASDLWEK